MFWKKNPDKIQAKKPDSRIKRIMILIFEGGIENTIEIGINRVVIRKIIFFLFGIFIIYFFIVKLTVESSLIINYNPMI